MARKRTSVEDVSEQAVEEPVDTLPAADAIAEASAILGTVDTPEDAVQRELFPRPPFDHRAAFSQIAEKAAIVTDLGKHMESTQAAYKRAKADWEEGAKELQALITDLSKAMRESEREPEPHQLNLTGEGCAWEQEHPGEVCAVCSRQRAALRPVEEPIVGETLDVANAEAATV